MKPGRAGQPILLHIDDDPDVLRVVASAFEDRAFVTSVTSLEAAREVLGGCGFDLIILDVALGDGLGWSCCRTSAAFHVRRRSFSSRRRTQARSLPARPMRC
jgi:DNA-binding response OmpR family regulator